MLGLTDSDNEISVGKGTKDDIETLSRTGQLGRTSVERTPEDDKSERSAELISDEDVLTALRDSSTNNTADLTSEFGSWTVDGFGL